MLVPKHGLVVKIGTLVDCVVAAQLLVTHFLKSDGFYNLVMFSGDDDHTRGGFDSRDPSSKSVGKPEPSAASDTLVRQETFPCRRATAADRHCHSRHDVTLEGDKLHLDVAGSARCETARAISGAALARVVDVLGMDSAKTRAKQLHQQAGFDKDQAGSILEHIVLTEAERRASVHSLYTLGPRDVQVAIDYKLGIPL
jgi:hypothetical protein